MRRFLDLLSKIPGALSKLRAVLPYLSKLAEVADIVDDACTRLDGCVRDAQARAAQASKPAEEVTN